mmetsp:Transcript_25132/g.83854  ORF Transcript_25132/g.83854 Transcript_25132/m.83854 type:complete len:274 (-) Transcript_25132:15-836(-)
MVGEHSDDDVASAQLLHAICTCVEYAGIACIWAHQGVLQPAPPFIKGQVLASRVRTRLSLSGLREARQRWRELLIVALLGSLALITFGVSSGFIWPMLSGSWSSALQRLCVTFLMPAFFEEVLFRAMLLPCREDHGAAFPGGLSAALPVRPSTEHSGSLAAAWPCDAEENLWEELGAKELPLCSLASSAPGFQPRTSSRPPLLMQASTLAIFVTYHLDFIHSLPVFRDVRFLVLALILGTSCQEALLRTGSVWPGIVMHWLWVWCWLTLGFRM